MEDSYLFESEGNVVKVEDSEDGRKILFLDQTIFYPQGGGQPYDLGRIVSEKSVFKVEEVRFKDGFVYHIGRFENGEIGEGESVKMEIERERRVLHSKLQSGGHLIDMAMRHVGYEDRKPTKGFHFPEGPNVEYEGVIDEQEREGLVNKLNQELERMTLEGYQVVTKMVSIDQLGELCYFVPDQIPQDKPVRIVAVWDDQFIPCGGTHVQNIRELSGIKVTKIKCKGGSTKVGYTL